MTIITTDGLQMAADSCCFQNDLMFVCIQPKIARAPDGTLVGATGASGDGIALRDWVRRGMDFTKPPQFSFREVASDNSLLWLWLRGEGDVHMGDCTMAHWPVPTPTTIGYGAQFLNGLLTAGMPLLEAVALTIHRTPYLGGMPQVERLPPPTRGGRRFDPHPPSPSRVQRSGRRVLHLRRDPLPPRADPHPRAGRAADAPLRASLSARS